MALVDGRIELHARVATVPRGFSDPAHQLARSVSLHRLARSHSAGHPIHIVNDSLHKFIRDAHAVVGVLEKDGRVRLAIERGIVARID
jgi:hypothetical protein